MTDETERLANSWLADKLLTGRLQCRPNMTQYLTSDRAASKAKEKKKRGRQPCTHSGKSSVEPASGCLRSSRASPKSAGCWEWGTNPAPWEGSGCPFKGYAVQIYPFGRGYRDRSSQTRRCPTPYRAHVRREHRRRQRPFSDHDPILKRQAWLRLAAAAPRLATTTIPGPWG